LTTLVQSRSGIVGAVQEMLAHRDLLFIITWREIRIRYKQSVMGFLWAILMPLIITGAGVLLRIAASKMASEPLNGDGIASVALKSLPWAFFVSALRFGTNSLTSNSHLVTKIKFPRMIFPLSSVASALTDLAVAAPLIILLLPFLGVHASLTMLWGPVILLILVLFTAGVCIFTSAVNLFFRDVKYIIEVILTFAIFFTPVLYDAHIAGKWQWLLMLNPIAPLLEALTATVIRGQQPDFPWLGYSVLMTAIFLLGGITLFRALEPRFAESV
jgi:ABC-type polysaccharide/polyol phosphate export permease